ncbi:MAG: tetratricopeptide repeat protein [Hyphomicrobiaceae bacterium]
MAIVAYLGLSIGASALGLWFLSRGLSGAPTPYRSAVIANVRSPRVLGAILLMTVAGAAIALGGISRDPPVAAAPGSDDPVAKLAAMTDQMSRIPTASISTPVPHQNLPSVDEMIERLAKRLEENPSDADGWRMLGWSHLHMQRYEEAVRAYAQAVGQAPQVASYRSSHAEALIRAANGTVTQAARAEIQEALRLDPRDGLALKLQATLRTDAGRKPQ